MADFTENNEADDKASFYANCLWASSSLIDDIMAQCNVDESTQKERYKFVRGTLVSELNKRIIIAILANISPYDKEFEDFSNSATRINPKLAQETVLVSFTILYPELRKKVFEEMEVFFENFVTQCNTTFGE